MKKLGLMLLLISGLSKGQYLDNLTYGLKLGALYSRVTNLPEMLIGRENNRQLFDITSKGVFGVEGGLFINFLSLELLSSLSYYFVIQVQK